ncbi:MAG: hypothetical protein JXQ91_07110 [Vannielia sp.]|uniref:hypothetical protein n=1 Tax=Rhodobacterales TaxID=204455 RepID=UPI0020946327|nr:hypothetical protein [Oceanicola sp. 502str15]MCO6384238.1 hypothetical protein [Oceanicola sp. 502str15]
MKLVATALALLLAAPLSAATLTGTWNCQVSEGPAALGRVVTYEPGGKFTGRQAFQIKRRYKGQTGLAKIAFSAAGRYVVEGNVLAERVDRTHSPSVTVTTEGKATRLRGPEADRARREVDQPHHVRYYIRRLTDTRLVLEYVSPGGRKADNLRMSCRRTNG